LAIPIGDTTEDVSLTIINRTVTKWFEELLNRKFSLAQRTQYYDGTGTQKLLLRCRPVFPLPGTPQQITVNVDTSGYYGTAPGGFASDPNNIPLVYGTDFTLKIDQDDGSSRSGILIRINDFWPKPQVRQIGYLTPFVGDDTGSIQVTYVAGFTVDSLPAELTMAAELVVSKLRYVLPLGVELGSESYEERSISALADAKNYILTPTIRAMILSHRNWTW
jgi:hypothetical protein